MKKWILGFCFLLLILTSAVLLSSCTQQKQPDASAPDKTAINNAVSWAESLIGKDSFPVVDGSLEIESWMQCSTFTANAYGSPASNYHTAYLLWFLSDTQHPGDWNAPRGSLVFFDRIPGTTTLGHVALSTGNGNLIEAGYAVIMESTIQAESMHTPYLGWAWPPSDWPGRRGGSLPTAVMIAIVAVLIAILAICIRRSNALHHRNLN